MDWMGKSKNIRPHHPICRWCPAQWKDTRVKHPDTPGRGLLSSSTFLRVLGGAVTVLDSQSGVEPQTEGGLASSN